MKIIKPAKFSKLPKATRSVQDAFQKSMDKAREENWNKVIIIGQGKEAGGYRCSNMLDDEIVGILEKVKLHLLLDD